VRISQIPKMLKEHIESVAHTLPSHLEKVVLFGSYARGEATLRSDVDIALVFAEGTEVNPRDRAFIREELETLVDPVEINLFTTCKSQLDTDNKLNANYWIREEGYVLWENLHINT